MFFVPEEKLSSQKLLEPVDFFRFSTTLILSFPSSRKNPLDLVPDASLGRMDADLGMV